MSDFDRRTTPMNAHIIADHLPFAAEGRQVVAGQRASVCTPVADLLRAPDGARDRQLLLGESVTLYDQRNGYAFVQAEKDGYVGYLRSDDIGPYHTVTHQIQAPMTHVYSAPDFKSPERKTLSQGSLLTVVPSSETNARFAETSAGFVPRAHISALDAKEPDGVAVAESFLGTPYLWGGNSSFGIDCSGLVQAALVSMGQPCPGDSDQQEQTLGTALKHGTPYLRGDLLFWKGHVALVVTPETLIHANVHHMAVAYENIHAAITRIETQGDGPVTAHKRVSLLDSPDQFPL
ncbi:NlpC/P60 family protein [Epibacterium ulvae]|uniref:C40 family peptidase n=1 Tax=Epibacterium ulvae TaxID=1156985 RepID=UPI0024919E91|nr:NlpC/P60 family protein [Epibacterium ulvae]